ncbi:hypothetical protein MEQU1_003471 [Malassezia equina]|uniref:Methyltransferase type 11 domain-containing protein n=1 Tax=Malassezia equina TaxID=1381935 RepID=A0AAF0EMB4_9BASI|nr:hypothetical protein MEQU1_003471 [Malassezia equina]
MQAAPAPNSPYMIFDREAKRMQRSRAAVRRPVNESGTAYLDESHRGKVSRVTDYVRDMGAMSLAERLQDIKRKFPVIVELGAGAGHLRHHLDANSAGLEKLIMCDMSEEMLYRDAHLDEQFPYKIERQVIDEEWLPFEENSLDCVIAPGSLHWTNDLPGALIQIQRVLKPDGVFLGYMLGGETLFELRTSMMLAEQEREGGLSVHVSPMTDTKDVSSLLTRAGFTLQTVDIDELTVNYPSMFELVQDLRDMGESNAVINRRPFLHRDTLIAAAATYQALHGSEEGHVPATYAQIYMVRITTLTQIGWKPSPDQKKPAKRGSAKQSLKDVL